VDSSTYLLVSFLGKYYPVASLIIVSIIAIIFLIKKYNKNPIIFKKDLDVVQEKFTKMIDDIGCKAIDIEEYSSLEEATKDLQDKYSAVSEKFNQYVKLTDFEKLDEKFDTFKCDIKDVIYEANEKQRQEQKEDFKDIVDLIERNNNK